MIIYDNKLVLSEQEQYDLKVAVDLFEKINHNIKNDVIDKATGEVIQKSELPRLLGQLSMIADGSGVYELK